MENFNNLKKWLNKENDNLKMFEKESRGLYSIENIKKGDRIMEIPKKFILELTDIDDKNITKKLNNTNSYFAIHLLLESFKKKSHWMIYINSLPSNLDEYMFYYDEEKIAQLKNTSIMCNGTHNFLIQFNNIKEDSKILYKWVIKKKLLNKELLNYEDFFKLFLKFRIYVCSRIFSYNKDNIEENGMVPYADLLNHSIEPNTTWYYDNLKNVFVVEATKNINKNEEIYDTYGSKTNMQLLMYYGFTIKNNKLSELNLNHKKTLFTIGYNSNIKEIILNSCPIDFSDDIKVSKKSLIHKIKKILNHHTKKIKGGKIKDNNILNIYNDEINLIKNVLQK